MLFDLFVEVQGVAMPFCLTHVTAATAREGTELAAEVIAVYRTEHPRVAPEQAELRDSRGNVFAGWKLSQPSTDSVGDGVTSANYMRQR